MNTKNIVASVAGLALASCLALSAESVEAAEQTEANTNIVESEPQVEYLSNVKVEVVNVDVEDIQEILDIETVQAEVIDDQDVQTMELVSETSNKKSSDKTKEQKRGVKQKKSKSTQKSKEDELRDSVMKHAKKYQGVRYRYGGTSPKGFDCSGFTQRAYKDAGVKLPRTAEAQRRASKKVNDPRPGDLVFFSHNGGRSAGHVGIYVGNGRYIGSQSSTGVAVTGVFGPYWKSRFMGYGRIV